jgi:hypothetical protein
MKVKKENKVKMEKNEKKGKKEKKEKEEKKEKKAATTLIKSKDCIRLLCFENQQKPQSLQASGKLLAPGC